MPYWTYILQSESSDRYYCGSTDDVERRVRQHNDPQYIGSKTTKRFKGPWTLVWKQQCRTRSEAMAVEKAVKKRGIKRFLESTAQLEESRPRRD
jgi:putative endonuclease